uniref:Torsin family 3 member A n=1 Tax=Bubo bubo TaxID=30461 RepID=A0A8C0FH42_BUBBB
MAQKQQQVQTSCPCAPSRWGCCPSLPHGHCPGHLPPPRRTSGRHRHGCGEGTCWHLVPEPAAPRQALVPPPCSPSCLAGQGLSPRTCHEGTLTGLSWAAAQNAKMTLAGMSVLRPLPFPGWSLPLSSATFSPLISTRGRSWACKLRLSSCPLFPAGLEADLNRQLHGQHLAKEVVVQAVQRFLQSPRPEKALVLSFHGWSGTGKNFVARMVASHLYRDGLKSECVRVFISLLHFPHHKYVDSYKAQLKKQISETVQLCRQSLIIFDEAEKLHFGLLDAIKPFMARYDSKGQVDYQRSIFLFLSNLGGNTINEVALDFWRAGRAREDISMDSLWVSVSHHVQSGYACSLLLKENLIDFFVPFLPLEYHHVKLCARDAFLARGLPYTEAALDEVARMMVFVPKEEKLFSAQGCKSVSQRINYFLP